MIVTDKLSTESFHAFIDEQLTDEQYVQVEAQLDEIPEKLDEIQQCHIINERLREVFDPVVEEPLPEGLFELGMYGITSEVEDSRDTYYQEADYQEGHEENAMAFSSMEDDIETPLDSMGAALDLQDENFIDDNDFSDIEALSNTQELAEFDIDALQNDGSNIIPDIFDDNSTSNNTESYKHFKTGPTVSRTEEKEILDAIESLSLDSMEETREFVNSEKKNLADEAVELEVEDVSAEQLDDFSTDEIALQQLEEAESLDAIKPEAFNVPEHLQEHILREQILDALESSEELQLEPLDNDHGVIALPEDKEQPQQERAEIEANYSVAQLGELESKSRNVLGAVQQESESDELSPEDGAAGDIQNELFERVDDAQQKMSSDSQESSEPPAVPSKETRKDGGAKETLFSQPITEALNDIDEIHDQKNSVPEDVVAEFFSGNKNEADFEVSEVVKQFEEVSGQFDHLSEDHLFDDSPVNEIKYKAHDFLNVVNNKFNTLKTRLFSKQDESFPDFNKAPPASYFERAPVKKATADDGYDDIPSIEEFLANDNMPSALRGNDDANNNVNRNVNYDDDVTRDSTSAASTARGGSPSPSLFDFESEDDEQSAPGIFSNKIGETLKHYKQKMSELKLVENSEPASGSGFSKLRILESLEKVSPENRMTIGGAILLTIGLLIGVSSASLMQETSNIISDEKVEQLAIDAHVLYAQQDQNFAANSSASIIESMQWLSARIGKQIRLADVKLDGFKHEKSILIPTMANYASANIYENDGNQKMTLLVAANIDNKPDSAMVCRVPGNVDGLCSWAKDSVRYVVVANLSLSRVRAFSQALVEKL